ncbi:MAG: hypothetical protein LC109_13895 [Bacteroidia bacterium]|nr:hypothetical protein [Bacteroidia bacterium]
MANYASLDNDKVAVSPNIEVSQFIEDLKEVEKIYFYSDEQDLKKTCTRIRVHSYGTANITAFYKEFIEERLGKIFNNTIPLASYRELSGYERKLEKNHFYYRDKLQVYERLTSHADENGTRDNPSPYLLHNGNKIDLGQILYGFESLVYQSDIGYYTGPFTYRRDYTEYNTYHEPNSNPSQYPKTYSNSYNTIRIRRVNDLAGWLANVATPIAEVLQHAINGESMYKNNKNVKDENKPASENDRDEYYKISAPDADLFGNVDAIGIYYAYKKLQHHGTKLRLSDVFELYYNGSCSSGLTPKDDAVLIPGTSQPMPHTTDKRWLIFGIHFGFVRFAGINKYTWLPNYKYAWNKFLSSDESNLNNRITSFAEFWTTRLAIYGKNDTWGTKQAKEWYRVRKAGALMVFNRDPFIEYTFKFHPSNEWLQGNDLLTKIVNNKKYFFEEKFLPWLKAKIHTDNPNITLK